MALSDQLDFGLAPCAPSSSAAQLKWWEFRRLRFEALSTVDADLEVAWRRSDSELDPVLFGAFAVTFFALVFLQKMGVWVDFAQIALYVSLGWLIWRGRASVSVIRLVLFSVFLLAAVASLLTCGEPFSPLSICFLISLYLPFVFRWRVSRAGWRRIVAPFQDFMVLASAMVFVQIAFQFATHGGVLSLESLVPRQLLIGGYNYQAPIRWGEPWIRPNGFFMLEPSYISAFAATAFVLEACNSRRIWRLALYGGAIIASTGATGLVLTAVAGPLLLVRQRMLVSLAVVVLGAATLSLVAATGIGQLFLGRLAEFGNTASSGFGRLVEPAIQLVQLAGDPNHLRHIFTGAGAGNLEVGQTIQSSAWPIVKLSIEYGFLAGILFFVFIASCFIGCPEPALAAGLFVIYNFTGSYLLCPILPPLMVLTITSLRIEPDVLRRVVRRGVEIAEAVVTGQGAEIIAFPQTTKMRDEFRRRWACEVDELAS